MLQSLFICTCCMKHGAMLRWEFSMHVFFLMLQEAISDVVYINFECCSGPSNKKIIGCPRSSSSGHLSECCARVFLSFA
jgi:hypothetical protein